MASSPQSNVDYSKLLNFAPWLVIAVVLTGAAQFDSTSKLAAAFAYLILVASLLYYGPDAFKNINGQVTSSPATTTGGDGGAKAT